MLEAIFELIVPLVVASIIDNGILKNNISYVVICSAILVALAVIGMVAAITAQYFAAKAATDSEKSYAMLCLIRLNLFLFRKLTVSEHQVL